MALAQSRVEEFARDGAGVVEVEGRAYFIDGVLPGEVVEFEMRKKRRGKFLGRLTRIIQPSPDRVVPRCEYFGVCGGCAQQHIEPAAQLAFKEKALFDALTQTAKTLPENRLPPICASIWHYRRKARAGIRHVPKKGGILVGFRERNSSYITSLMSCATLDAGLSELLPGLHELLQRLSCPERIPQLEMVAADNALALVLRHLQPLCEADRALLREFARREGVQFFLQPGGLDTVAPLWPESPQALYYRLDDYDLKMEFAPTDFIQVNGPANERMIELAMRLLAPTLDDDILDLFCGLGNFTLPIARSGARVLGVEGEAGLVDRGRENAARNGLANAAFEVADLHQPTALGRKFEKVLLDPPRSGAVDVVKSLIPEIDPRVIVYASCNPATFARDAGILTHLHGYKMTHAGVIDMFPHTAGIESMARFEREG